MLTNYIILSKKVILKSKGNITLISSVVSIKATQTPSSLESTLISPWLTWLTIFNKTMTYFFSPICLKNWNSRPTMFLYHQITKLRRRINMKHD